MDSKSLDSDSTLTSMKEKLAKRWKKEPNPKYANCNFILCSIAGVERTWSIAKHFLSFQRRLISHQLFEALIFLKLIGRFWDYQLVSQAI